MDVEQQDPWLTAVAVGKTKVAMARLKRIAQGMTPDPEQVDVVLAEDGQTVHAWVYWADAQQLVAFTLPEPVEADRFDHRAWSALLMEVPA